MYGAGLALSAMIIKEKSVNGLSVLTLTGRLDIFSRNAFKDRTDKYCEPGTKGLILDFQGVTFMDSVGLGILTLVAKHFQKLKSRIIVVNPQNQVKTLLLEMKLGRLVPLYHTDETFSQFSQL